MAQIDPPFDLLYCHASPLMCNHLPLPALDVKTEWRELFYALNEIHKEIRIRSEIATYDTLMQSLTLGTKVLHYTGHGKEGALVKLAFEPAYRVASNAGEAQLIKSEQLQSLLDAGGNHVQLAFVCACESHAAGVAFVNAKVPHVIAATEKISDLASQAFAKHFYLSLFSGKSVLVSFRNAQHAVQQAGQDNGKLNEQEKFELLPFYEDIDPLNPHHVILFDLSSRPNGRVNIHEQPVCTFEQSPPSIYWGRNPLLCDTLRSVLNKDYRLTEVQGVDGIGKSALLKCLGQYVADRKHYRIGSIGYVDFKNPASYIIDDFGRIDLLSNSLSSVIALNTPVINESVSKVSDAQKFTQKKLIEELNKPIGADGVSHLLLLDSVDYYPNNHEFEALLCFLLDRCKNVKVVISYSQRIPLKKPLASKIVINPLTDELATQLFVSRVSNLRSNVCKISPAEKQKLVYELKLCDGIKDLKGNPALVEEYIRSFNDHTSRIPIITVDVLREFVKSVPVINLTPSEPKLDIFYNTADSLKFPSHPVLNHAASYSGAATTKIGPPVNLPLLKHGFKSYSVINEESSMFPSQPILRNSISTFKESESPEWLKLSENGKQVWIGLGNPLFSNWSDCSHAMYSYFKSSVSFERPLDGSDFLFLCSRLQEINGNVNVEKSISLEQFAKFWPWFEGACNMIVSFLPIWNAQSSNPLTVNLHTRLIAGFISKQKANEMLASCLKQEGTFVLRFASHAGCLAASYVSSGTIQHSLLTYVPNGFSIEIENNQTIKYQTLTELVLKCQKFQVLYPNVEKKRAFTLVYADSAPD